MWYVFFSTSAWFIHCLAMKGCVCVCVCCCVLARLEGVFVFSEHIIVVVTSGEKNEMWRKGSRSSSGCGRVWSQKRQKCFCRLFFPFPFFVRGLILVPALSPHVEGRPGGRGGGVLFSFVHSVVSWLRLTRAWAWLWRTGKRTSLRPLASRNPAPNQHRRQVSWGREGVKVYVWEWVS